jgi:hypothetical protein
VSYWSFYDAKTGEFSRRCVNQSKQPRAPDGFVAIEGRYDKLTHRFDFESGVVVEEENTLAIEAIQHDLFVQLTKLKIDDLEKRQLRRMRDATLRPNERDNEGKLPSDRLREIDDEIATLRSSLRDP